MRFKTGQPKSHAKLRQAGFTLAEVLAALTFIAVVIPVAIEGLRIASLSGQVAHRKDLALRVAERVLNEAIVTRQWNQATRTGTAQEGPIPFRWTLRNESWNQDAMRQFSVDVAFTAQSKDYSVRLTTLVDTTTIQ